MTQQEDNQVLQQFLMPFLYLASSANDARRNPNISADSDSVTRNMADSLISTMNFGSEMAALEVTTRTEEILKNELRRKETSGNLIHLPTYGIATISFSDTNLSVIRNLTDLQAKIVSNWPAEDDTKLKCLSYSVSFHFYSTDVPFYCVPFVTEGGPAMSIATTESSDGILPSLVDTKIATAWNKQHYFKPLVAKKAKLKDIGGTLTRVYECEGTLDVSKYLEIAAKVKLATEMDGDPADTMKLCYALICCGSTGARDIEFDFTIDGLLQVCKR